MDYLLCWRGWLENGEDRTVNIFTVSFFGHRIIPEFREAEDRVEALVHALLLEKEYVEFLVGRDGDFDQIVSSAVKRQKRIVRDDNSSLIWILPYLPAGGGWCARCGQSSGGWRAAPPPHSAAVCIGSAAAARPAATRKVLFKFATGRW